MDGRGFSTVEQVRDFFESHTNLAGSAVSLPGVTSARRTYRLDRMRALLERFGNPQNSFCCVHLAGSKGKGSTASYIAAGLHAAGMRTGLYLSPHVSDFRERFTVDGSFLPDDVLFETADGIKSGLEGFYFCAEYGENVPTTFELYTLFAFLAFRRMKCAWAVIETGLGGRLDATNILMPEAVVLTPVELEHTDLLGNTIAEIAAEKSKIIKPGVPVFVSPQHPDARAVFEAEAYRNNAPVFFLQDMLREIESRTVLREGRAVQRTRINFRDKAVFDLELEMPGEIQAQNCALALAVLRHLGLYRHELTEKALEKNVLPGRMERLDGPVPLYIDGAHTPASVRYAIGTFRALYPGPGPVALFGCVSGKKHEEICAEILDGFETIIVTTPGTFKKSDPQALYGMLRSSATASGLKRTILLEPVPDRALELAFVSCAVSGAVLCLGSFYLAGEIKEALCRSTGKKPN